MRHASRDNDRQRSNGPPSPSPNGRCCRFRESPFDKWLNGNRNLELTMKYLCLVYQNEAGGLTIPPDDMGKLLREVRAYLEATRASGHLLGSNRLQPTRTATTVRVREGQTITTDGPFAETKEQLGGYLLIEASDLNEAIQVAARFPGARWGSVEVRPVQDMPPPE
jgi:hypothetical protein